MVLESAKVLLAGDIFVGDGEMAALMRSCDWAQTSLGPVADWPQSLRTALSICLASRFPIVLYWGPEFVTLYNSAYSQILAAKHPWALGRPCTEVWAEIWDVIGPMLQAVRATGEATWSDDQFLLLHRHGYPEECYFSFSFSPVSDEGGLVGGIFTAVTENTPRVIGERRLRLLRELAAQTAEATSVGEVCRRAAEVLRSGASDLPFALLYLLDEDGQAARLTETAGVSGGLTISPRSISLAESEMNRTVWPLAQVVRTGQAVIVPELMARLGQQQDGLFSTPPHSALVLPVRTSGQERLAGVLIAGVSPLRALDDGYRGFFDLVAGQVAAGIANARAWEEERKRVEALAELDRAKTIFFSNISHEFRTPLTLLLGPLADLLERSALAPDDRAQLEVAQRNGLRLLRLVNTLLDFSRIEAGRIQASYDPTDLAQLTADLASVFRSAIEKAGMRLTVDCQPLTSAVYVDREMWEKIVLNLLSNAFKFTFAGEITVTLQQRDEQAVLMVRDTGTGIPAEELPQLFQRFHRVRGARARTHEGSGIGLALVQELVRLHGGTIQVASEPGLGTTFTITIPTGSAHLPADRIQPPREESPAVAGANLFVEEALRWLPDDSAVSGQCSAVSGAGSETTTDKGQRTTDRARILLADDNADMRDYVRRLLSRQYQVEAVADGAEALRAARRQPPDLVLTDVMMPGQDGFELLRELRADERTREVPVILLSARAGEESRIEGLESGADDYLIKPFSARELLARVSTHLELARVRREAAARQREQTRRLQQVADAALAINMAYTLEDALRAITERAREVIGAHIAATSLTTDQSLAQSTITIALSDKYAEWRDREALPDLTGIRSAVCETNQPLRMTQAELAAHPAWRSAEAGSYLPLRGWLAAPLVGNDGRNIGIVQLSDKETGEFTEADEAILVQLAQLASVAIENARLYHEVREASRLKDEFLTVVSHELRTPLNSILGWTRILRSRTPDEAACRRALEIIENSACAQQQLIEDLLDTARIISGKLRLRMQQVALPVIIRVALETVRPAAVARAIELHAGFEPDVPPVTGDPTRLQQVIWNLLSNGIKFTPSGGRVEVRLERCNSDVRIIVSDTGQGIAPEFLPFVFDRFRQADGSSTRRQGGLGLGLALVKHLTELHGGTVSAESAGAGQGATFIVRLPVRAAPQALSAAAIAQAQARESGSFRRVPSLRGLRALLLDHDQSSRQLITMILTRCGARVVTAASATEALALLFRAAAEEQPQVLIADISRPDAEGYELIRQVRAQEQSENRIPAIALTADARAEGRLRALATGFQMHVPKPVEPEELIVVIASVTGRAGEETRTE
ncbi:MAG TPA: ATP-binding protein [Blastocatellia bacterium]|nr:ATP-binding protein [Blastocatellia bacterium]